MTYKKSLLSISIAAFAVAQSLGSTAVVAQEGMLEEVIVTATKRAESLQDIPGDRDRLQFRNHPGGGHS